MDPLSHALVGGTSAVLRTKNSKLVRAAVLCGVVAGMSPDLDVLIREAGNPMFGLGFHRHFTHALAFAPVGALAVAAFMWLFLRKQAGYWTLYLFCLTGMFMHGILDAMTNYGTHLFWPFTGRRESWSIISIIDPIFTLTMLTLLSIAYRKSARRFAVYAACFALAYWSFGYYQREQATDAMRELAAARGHAIERSEVKPSIGNLFAWRVQYLHKGRIYIDAFHVSPWKGRVHYEGGSLPLFIQKTPLSTVQQQDLDYFTFFSDGWLAAAPLYPDMVGDVRFSSLPNQLDPIWGITFMPETPESHVTFRNARVRTEGDLGVLWKMVKGDAVK